MSVGVGNVFCDGIPSHNIQINLLFYKNKKKKKRAGIQCKYTSNEIDEYVNTFAK